MLSSCYSQSLARRPLLSSPVTRVGVSARPRSLCPHCRSSRISYTGSSYPKKGWKILCFRDDSPSPETPPPDYLEHLLPSLKPECDNAIVPRLAWKTKLSEEAPPDNEFEKRIRQEVIPASEISVTFVDI
ncbi:hypothetical protein SAY86_027200 [Trapa natans]|uniref:Uncharacterized protein n=1 Tax=Trapa natans TaxID=22666 RepID=A0AAN7KLX1_TRANT|nr:hypothetical protein SAY86_027200 [Trapa natans]